MGSKRKGGNTDVLVKAFVEGASLHNHVEVVSVADYRVLPCTGCNNCFHNEGYHCCQQDDMQTVYQKLSVADVVVVASPVYFYGLSASLKAIIDRLHTPLRNTFAIKKVGLLLVAAATLPSLFDAIVVQYELVLNFFHLEDVGRVLVKGVKDRGDIKGNPALDDAYRMGMDIR